MRKLDQTVDEHLRTIEASCPRLLYALHATLEAVWGEIMRMELACGGLEEAGAEVDDESAAVREIITLVEALRCEMAKDGLMGAHGIGRVPAGCVGPAVLHEPAAASAG